MTQLLNVESLQEGQRQEDNSLDFADVFAEYQRPIYNYLLRMTQNQAEAEDLTQETFIRVNRSLPTFRGEASLSTWIYRIATNPRQLSRLKRHNPRENGWLTRRPPHQSRWRPSPKCRTACRASSGVCPPLIARYWYSTICKA